MSNTPMTFEVNYKIPLLSHYVNGSQIHKPRNKVWAFKFTYFQGITVFTLISLIYSITTHDIIERNFEETCKNGTMFIIGTVITFKYGILLYHKKDILKLISVINKDYKTAVSLPSEERKIVEEHAKTSIFVSKLWVFAATSASALFPAVTIYRLVYLYRNNKKPGLIPFLDINYPPPLDEYKHSIYGHIVTTILCFSFAIYAGSMYMGFDPLPLIFMLHACGQLELNEKRILSLFSKYDDNERIVMELRQMVIHLQELYSFVATNEKCFTIIYEWSMITTTLVIPITAFQIVQSLQSGYINFEFAAVFCACFVHCYLPCYFSNLLMDKGDTIRIAAYGSGWETRMDKNIRQTLLIMMTQASRCMALRSVFTILNLDSFAKMCKQAYGIFNLMNAALNDKS